MKQVFSFLLIALFSLSVMGQEKEKAKTKETNPVIKIIGDWKGALSVQGQELPLVFHFKLNEKKELVASLDSPAQNGFDIPMGKVTLEEKKYKIDATDLGASFEGQLKDDLTLVGQWSQGGMSFDLVMKKEIKKKK